MKKLAVVMGGFAVFCSFVSLTALDLLGNFTGFSTDIRGENLLVGNLLPMLFGNTLWSRFPSLPPIAAALDWRMLTLMVGVIVLVVHVVRYQMNRSWIEAGLVTFLSASIPYLLGAMMLHGNEDLSQCGPWLALMLEGGLYAQLGTVACAGAAVAAKENSAGNIMGVASARGNAPSHQAPTTSLWRADPVLTGIDQGKRRAAPHHGSLIGTNGIGLRLSRSHQLALREAVRPPLGGAWQTWLYLLQIESM